MARQRPRPRREATKNFDWRRKRWQHNTNQLVSVVLLRAVPVPVARVSMNNNPRSFSGEKQRFGLLLVLLLFVSPRVMSTLAQPNARTNI